MGIDWELSWTSYWRNSRSQNSNNYLFFRGFNQKTKAQSEITNGRKNEDKSNPRLQKKNVQSIKKFFLDIYCEVFLQEYILTGYLFSN